MVTVHLQLIKRFGKAEMKPLPFIMKRQSAEEPCQSLRVAVYSPGNETSYSCHYCWMYRVRTRRPQRGGFEGPRERLLLRAGQNGLFRCEEHLLYER